MLLPPSRRSLGICLTALDFLRGGLAIGEKEAAQWVRGMFGRIAGLYAAGCDQANVMGGHYPSGGINLDSVKAIAETGVDLLSSGALTHSAPILDVGLDIENA